VAGRQGGKRTDERVGVGAWGRMRQKRWTLWRALPDGICCVAFAGSARRRSAPQAGRQAPLRQDLPAPLSAHTAITSAMTSRRAFPAILAAALVLWLLLPLREAAARSWMTKVIFQNHLIFMSRFAYKNETLDPPLFSVLTFFPPKSFFIRHILIRIELIKLLLHVS